MSHQPHIEVGLMLRNVSYTVNIYTRDIVLLWSVPLQCKCMNNGNSLIKYCLSLYCCSSVPTSIMRHCLFQITHSRGVVRAAHCICFYCSTPNFLYEAVTVPQNVNKVSDAANWISTTRWQICFNDTTWSMCSSLVTGNTMELLLYSFTTSCITNL